MAPSPLFFPEKQSSIMIMLWLLLVLLGLGISSAAKAASAPLAEMDGVAITSEEVDKPLASQLSKLETLTPLSFASEAFLSEWKAPQVTLEKVTDLREMMG